MRRSGILKPVSLPLTRETGGTWEVRQDFIRLGRRVHLVGWGISRADAFKALEREILWEDQPSPQPFKALYDTLWDAAGTLDSLIRFLVTIKARLIKILYP